MQTNPNIFKAYDIRGIYGEDLNEDTAYRLGFAYTKLRKKEMGQDKCTFVVAADMRLSSPQLKASLIKGLTEAGADVVDIGLASTPTFYFAVAHFHYDGGLIVSASHNPKEYNGFKIVRDKAIPVSGDTGMYELRDMVMADEIEKATTPGSVSTRDDVLATQVSESLKFADLAQIKPFKIVVDPANAMGAQYCEALFRELPCELIRMNFELDGNFPAHEADPFKPENTKDLVARVVAEKADLGIAIDGDGDRIFFADNSGTMIEPGIARAILCKIFLNDRPGAKIAYDIRPGRITPETIVANGGTPVVTKVGHSLIKEKAMETGCYFAGESSGHFFLNLEMGCFEMPLIMILKLLQEFSVSGQSAAEYVKPYQKYFHSGEINTRVTDPDAIIEEIKDKYADGELHELDIITITYPDYWFNVRKSNTEPLLRFTLEATSPEIMAEKRDEILSIIRK